MALQSQLAALKQTAEAASVANARQVRQAACGADARAPHARPV